MVWNWSIPLTNNSLLYVGSRSAKLFGFISKLLPSISAEDSRAVALGVAGAVAREETGQDKVYPPSLFDRLDEWNRDVLLKMSHTEIEQSYQNFPYNESLGIQRLNQLNTDLVAVGKIKLVTSIDLLNKYQLRFALLGSNDPLELSKYYADYPLFMKDLVDPTGDLALKIALLVVEESYLHFSGSFTIGAPATGPAHNPSNTCLCTWLR